MSDGSVTDRVNRADLAWALGAALPHAAKVSELLCGVALESAGGQLYAYSTDRYSIGIGRIEYAGDVSVNIPVAEAKDLLRFVKPTLKKHDVEDVQLLVSGDELHVALEDDESAVFSLSDGRISLEEIFGQVERIAAWPREYGEMIYNPDLFGKFAKAVRDGERVHIFGHSPPTDNTRGMAVVTVGGSFLGAVAGIKRDETPAHALGSWGLGDAGEVAA